MIKLRGTRVGSDGTGHHEGTDGRMYYGNPKNGYVTDSLEQQENDRQKRDNMQIEEDRKRRLEERDAMRATSETEETSLGAVSAGAGSGLAATVVLGAMMALILYGAMCFLFLEAVIVAWPDLLDQLFLEYRWGNATLGTALRTVNAAGLIGLFVLELRRVADGRDCVKQYLWLAIALTVVTGAVSDWAAGAFHLFDLILYAFRGLRLAVLPALILYYREFKRDGGHRFLRYLAWKLCHRLPGCSKVFQILGTATCVVAVLGVLLLRGNMPPFQIAVTFLGLMVCGLMGVYIGRAGKA